MTTDIEAQRGWSRPVGVLADVAWMRPSAIVVDTPALGLLTCVNCINGAAHPTYRPVREYRQLAREFLAIERPDDVLAFAMAYGFVDNRHGVPPATLGRSELVFRAADLRDCRSILLEHVPRRLLDDSDLLVRADGWRAERERARHAATRADLDPAEIEAAVAARVPSLSLDQTWRRSALAASDRRVARDIVLSTVRAMDIRWSVDASAPIVELVPTNLLQLVGYALLQDIRGDEALDQCLMCGRPLERRPDGRGRPRLYCDRDPETGRDCAAAARNLQRREDRRRLRTP
jgi:hypothetical protein